MDVSQHIVAKSDQLNAADLLGGPIRATITACKKGSREQPVALALDGGHRDWKPSKTSLRVLAHAWGTDASKWVGRSVELYRDETVLWAGEPVGGIRISALSDIPKPLALALQYTRGKTKQHRVDVLKASKPTPPLDEILADNELTRDDVNRWLESTGQKSLSEASHDGLPAYLMDQSQGGIDAIRALIPVL